MRCLFLILTFYFAQCVKAQDLIYSNPQSAPLETNPSYAGNDTCSSARLSYRLQWPKISPGIHQTYFATSIYLPQPFMFVGARYRYTYDGVTDMHYTALFAAKYFKLSKNQELRVALDMAFYQGQLDWNRVDFNDQVDSSGNGAIYPTNDVPRGGSHGGIDWNAGLSYHLFGFHFGLAAYHLTQPNASFLLGYSRIPIRFSVTTGYIYPISWPWFGQNVGLHVLYKSQSASEALTLLWTNEINRKYYFNYSLTINHGILKHGFQTGYRLKSFTIGYSFDLYPSDFFDGLGNAHEFFLQYNFWYRKSLGRRINKGSVWN